MIMIQDDPMPTGADKPLRITGDPHKVQVGHRGPVCAVDFPLLHSILHLEKPLEFVNRISAAPFVNVSRVLFRFSLFFSFFFLQQARELVVKLIRDKDQGDFRVGRAEFGSKMGGSSLDVRLSPQFALIMMIGCRFKK